MLLQPVSDVIIQSSVPEQNILGQCTVRTRYSGLYILKYITAACSFNSKLSFNKVSFSATY